MEQHCIRVRFLPFGFDHTHVPGRLPSHGVACIKTSDEANVCGIASGTQPTKRSMVDLLEKLQCKGKYTAI